MRAKRKQTDRYAAELHHPNNQNATYQQNVNAVQGHHHSGGPKCAPSGSVLYEQACQSQP